MKQTGFVGDWDKGVPEYYQLQVQTQMLVLGVDSCVVCVRVGASDMRCHLVEADVFMHEEMVDAVSNFWDEVERG